MSKKRERVRQCRQIRQLIDENKYTKALELIDELPLAEVGSLDDLYLFAELYEKAERIEKKKEIFYHIYERTGSRYVLNRLLRLTIRMGDMEEARELYFAYEMAGGVTLDTFELRYLLAKAEGEPRKRLIEILEELKQEEYTEQWGLQLAYLYEQEGEREKCIQECRDLKLWFGDGEIVDKAMELMKRCEDPGWEPPQDDGVRKPDSPVVEESPEEIQEKKKKEIQEEEDEEDVSERGIRYRTLKNVINHVRYDDKTPHFVFAGGEERIALAVAKRMAKELNNAGHVTVRNIVKITSDKLNEIDLSEQVDRIAGGCMLVTGASELNAEAVCALVKIMEEEKRLVVMLTGPFDEIDCFLAIHSDLSEKLVYKIRM